MHEPHGEPGPAVPWWPSRRSALWKVEMEMSEPRSKDAQNLLPPLLACENVLIPGDLLEIPVNADHKTMGKGLCRGAPRRPGVLLKGSL